MIAEVLYVKTMKNVKLKNVLVIESTKFYRWSFPIWLQKAQKYKDKCFRGSEYI